ncbi:CD48 antigen-like isoform X2 [Mustelus asterias]
MAACHLSVLILFLPTLLPAGAVEVSVNTPDYPVNGSLGHSVWLPVDIDPILKDAEITWRFIGTPVTTIARFDVNENKIKIYSGRFSGRVNMYGNFTLQINELSKLDEGIYSVTVSASVDQKGEVCLQVYEPVSKPKVELINSTAGETCNVSLRCSVEGGDGVVYNWSPHCSNDTNYSIEPVSRNMEQLDVSVGMSDSIDYSCTAWNPVSKESVVFSEEKPCQHLRKDSSDFSGTWFTIIISIIAVIILIIIIVIFYKQHQKSGHGNAEDSTRTQQFLTRTPTIPNNYENIVQPSDATTVYAVVQHLSRT